jgi:hypothetical protein
MLVDLASWNPQRHLDAVITIDCAERRENLVDAIVVPVHVISIIIDDQTGDVCALVKRM